MGSGFLSLLVQAKVLQEVVKVIQEVVEALQGLKGSA